MVARRAKSSKKEPAALRNSDFFVVASERIYARLLSFGPTPDQLAAWVVDPSAIDEKLLGTECAILIDSSAFSQRQGILASLRLLAKTSGRL